jgi:hypothetical protein
LEFHTADHERGPAGVYWYWTRDFALQDVIGDHVESITMEGNCESMQLHVLQPGQETEPRQVSSALSGRKNWAILKHSVLSRNCKADHANNKVYFDSMAELDVGVKNSVCGVTIKTKPLLVQEHVEGEGRQGKCFDGGYEIQCAKPLICDGVHHICVDEAPRGTGKCKYDDSGVDWCSPLANEGEDCVSDQGCSGWKNGVKCVYTDVQSATFAQKCEGRCGKCQKKGTLAAVEQSPCTVQFYPGRNR